MLHYLRILFNKLLGAKDENKTGINILVGWTVSIYTMLLNPKLLGIWFSWETIITSIKGIAVAVASKMALDLYDNKIKPRLFKNKRNAKQKKDNSKAA